MKPLLLDTHVLLWWLGNDARLGPRSRARVREPLTRVFVSAATAWEVSVKRALGKLRAPPVDAALLERLGFEALPVELEHAERAGTLPPLHRDLFDRMLVAQAQTERLVLLSVDADVHAYDVDAADASE